MFSLEKQEEIDWGTTGDSLISSTEFIRFHPLVRSQCPYM